MNTRDNELRLLQQVEQYRDAECERLLQRAQLERADLLRNTYRRARRHLHQTVQSERTRARLRIRAAQAELETQRRQHQQRLGLVLLEAARKRLPDLLAKRWAESEQRADWIRGAVIQARDSLPPGPWRVRHARRFRAADNDTLLRALGDGIPRDVELLADAGIAAGLIIESGGIRLDASLEGLLNDRDAIEGRILGLVEGLREE